MMGLKIKQTYKITYSNVFIQMGGRFLMAGEYEC